MFYRILIAGVMLFATGLGLSHAQARQTETYSSLSDIPAPLMRLLGNTGYEEQYVYQTLAIIRQNSSDRMALTADDLNRIQEKKKQEQRRRQVQSLIVYDRDFDGHVTRDEVKESLSAGSGSQQDIDRRIANIMEADLDKNGLLTVKEMGAFAEQNLEKHVPGYSHQGNLTEDFLTLDPDKDGKLTVEELRTLALKAFRTADRDRDGILSQEERQNIKDAGRKQKEFGKLLLPDCALPAAEQNEKLVFIGVYGGRAVSTVSVAGQVSETNVIPVKIDPGSEKLYIVTSSFSPVIWQFQGATDRISRLVLAGRSMPEGTDSNDMGGSKINIGATGVAAGKITFRHGRTCGLRSAFDKSKKQSTLDVITKLSGRLPDMFYSGYAVTGLRIFGERINNDISKEIEESQQNPPKGFDPVFWKKHILLMPGGVVDLKHEQVVSDAPAVPYEVLPKWAGFAKLAYEGAVIPDNKSSGSTVIISGPGQSPLTVENFGSIKIGNQSPTISFGAGSAVKIVKNIPYYPSGLYGGFSATIILGKGVEPPKGIPGHSTVISEESGKQISGPGQ